MTTPPSFQLSMMRQACETSGCNHAAEAHVFGQWTIADFMSWEVCGNHVEECVQWMRAITVDGNPILELWVHYYDGPLLGTA